MMSADASALSTSVVLPGGDQITVTLSSDGYSTTLAIQTAGAGGSSSSSSSAGTGAWTAQPTIVSDGRSRLAVLIEGHACCTAFAVQAGRGGTSVSSTSIDRATFDVQHGSRAGFAAVPWAGGGRALPGRAGAAQSPGSMSVRELKAALASAGVDCSHCLERSELEQLWRAGAAPDPGPTDATEAMADVARRLGVDPLLLPERALSIHWAGGGGGGGGGVGGEAPPPADGVLRLAVSQEWLQDTTPDNTGSACWPGSLLLAHYLLSAAALQPLSPSLAGALAGATGRGGGRILELGCGGAALPGTCLLRRFPRAQLTFADRSARLLALAAKNVKRNAGGGGATAEQWRFAEVSWGGDQLPASVADSAGGCALVICAELLYEAAVAPLMLQTLSLLLSSDGVAVLAHRRRNGAHEAMVEAAAEYGLVWEPIGWRPWPRERATSADGADGGGGCLMSRSEAEAWGSPLSVLELGTLRPQSS